MPGDSRRPSHKNALSSRILLSRPRLFLLAALVVVAAVPGIAGAATVKSVTITPNPAQITIGQARQFQARVNFSDGTSRDVTTLAQWKSGSSKVAIVSTTAGSIGIVTAVGPGTVKISATFTFNDDKTTGSSDVTVVTPPLLSITTKPTTKKLEIGDDTEFKATGDYGNDFTFDITDTVDWSSTNPAVATVENTGPNKGLVHPLSVGTTTIVARDLASGITNSDGATTVRSAITSLSVDPSDVTTARRIRLPLRCVGNRDDGTHTNLTSDVEWISTKPTIATVGNGEIEGGVVRGIADGTTVVHCVDPKRNLSTVFSGGGANVTVAGRLVSLEVKPVTLAVGDQKGAHVIGHLQNNVETSDLADAVVWSIVGPDIATVGNSDDDRGDVTGLQRGTTTLRAVEPITQIASTDVDNLKVLGAIQSIAMETGEGVVGLGETVEFKVRATFEGGATSNISDKCDWSSDNTNIATVDNESPDKGMVTGVSARRKTATITAQCDAGTVSGEIQVIGRLVGIDVTPASFEDEALTDKKFHAVGRYDNQFDPNQRDLTKVVNWSSSAPDVVSIDNQDDPGQAMLLKPGSAILTAAHPTMPLSGTATVVVDPGIQTLQIVPPSKTVRASVAARFRAQGKRADGSIKIVTKQATWTADDPQIARVSDTEPGTVFGGSKEGTTTLHATLPGGFDATASFTTQGLLASFELIPESRTIPLLEARIVEARGHFVDTAAKKITRGVVFSSSDTNVVIVSNEAGSHGVMTAVGRGGARITAFDPSSGQSATNFVDVTVP